MHTQHPTEHQDGDPNSAAPLHHGGTSRASSLTIIVQCLSAMSLPSFEPVGTVDQANTRRENERILRPFCFIFHLLLRVGRRTTEQARQAHRDDGLHAPSHLVVLLVVPGNFDDHFRSHPTLRTERRTGGNRSVQPGRRGQESGLGQLLHRRGGHCHQLRQHLLDVGRCTAVEPTVARQDQQNTSGQST